MAGRSFLQAVADATPDEWASVNCRMAFDTAVLKAMVEEAATGVATAAAAAAAAAGDALTAAIGLPTFIGGGGATPGLVGVGPWSGEVGFEVCGEATGDPLGDGFSL